MRRIESFYQSVLRINRWAVVLLVVAALLGGVAASVGGAAASPAPQSPDPLTRRKIDAHYHFGGEGFIEETVANAEKYNTIYLTSVPYEKISVFKAAQEKHPGVFIGEGRIQLDDPDAVKKIEGFHRASFKAIGELTKPLKRFDDPAYYPIYEKAQELGLHVMFHTGIVNWRINRAEFSGMDRMRPAYLDLIMRRFPKLTIQGAHFGNPWYEEAAEVARWDPNLYFDLTGSSLLKKDSDPEFWGRILWWRPSVGSEHSPGGAHAFTKIIFGSDERPEGFLGNIERFEKVLNANNIPEDVRELCWYRTMAKILGVEE